MRSDYEVQGWALSRVSVQDPDAVGHGSWADQGSYAYMLMDDVRNGVVPYGRGPQGPQVALEPGDRDVEALVAEALSRDGNDWLDDALPEFVRECATEIITTGRAIREIGYWTDPTSRRRRAFRLLWLPSGSVHSRWRKPVQRLSDQAARRIGRRFVELPADDLLVFRWPARYFGSYESVMNPVKLVSATSLPGFLIPDPRTPGGPVPVDSTGFHGTLHRALAEATRPLGWNARGMFGKEQTDYHVISRHLRFERFKISLRSEILSTLNAGLRRAGERIGFKAEVAISGVPTEADIDEAEHSLAEGSESYKKIMALGR